MKKNCWEFKKCGRQLGGEKVAQLGICPAAVDKEFNEVHGGKYAGRACWVVVGSLCGGKIQGTFAQKLANCWHCDFFKSVQTEEGEEYSMSKLGMLTAKKKKK